MASTPSGPRTATATWKRTALELEHAPEPPGRLKSQVASSRPGVGPLQFANLMSSQMVLMPLAWGPQFEHHHRGLAVTWGRFVGKVKKSAWREL